MQTWVEIIVNGTTYMVAGNSPSFDVLDTSGDPSAPILLSTTFIETPFCPSMVPTYYAAKDHFLYVTALFKYPEVESCKGLGGELGTYPGLIYDLSDPSNPIFANYFAIPEIQTYTGVEIIFGSDEYAHIAAMAMQGSGLVFYDFSNGKKPVAISDVFTVETTVSDELLYLVGIMSIQYSMYPPIVYAGDGRWYASVTPDGKTGTLYEILLTV